MWEIEYKPGYFIIGNYGGNECTVYCFPVITGYKWSGLFKSSRAAKVAITKHIREQQSKEKQ